MKPRRLLCASALTALFAACDRAPSMPAPPPPIPPAAFSATQRSTTPLADGKLRVTIGDITRGQVLVSAADAAGEQVLPPLSMKAGAEAAFSFGGFAYRLTLAQLKNSLLGEDVADFTLAAQTSTPGKAAAAPSEAAKIEKLIAAVAAAKGAKFIRNGTEHDAAEAANHLRRKWRSAGVEKVTAEQFISEIASRSSLSGEVYQIRFPDGRAVPAGDFLRQRLRELEKTAR